MQNLALRPLRIVGILKTVNYLAFIRIDIEGCHLISYFGEPLSWDNIFTCSLRLSVRVIIILSSIVCANSVCLMTLNTSFMIRRE